MPLPVTVSWSETATPDENPDASLVDVSLNVSRIKISQGRDDELDVYASGKAEVTFINRDNVGHPLIFDMNTWYRRRQMQIDGPVGGLFRGFIRDVKHDLRNSPMKAAAVVELDDLLGVMADAELTGDWHDILDPLIDNEMYRLHTLEDGTEGVIARIGVDGYIDLVLARIGNTSFGTSSTGNAATLPLWIPFEQTGNVWAVLQSYLEAELGWVAAVGNNRALYHGGRWFPFYLASTDPTFAILVLSDTPDLGAGELGYQKDSLEWSSPASTYANSVVCQSVDGAPRLAEDIPVGWPRDSARTRDNMPIIDENWVQADADLLLANRKQTNTYPRQVKRLTWAEGSPALSGFPPAIGDVHLVRFTFPGGSQVTYTVFVESIAHEMDHESWTTTFGYTSADRWLNAYDADAFYPGPGLFTLDSASAGLDSGAIFAP